MLEEIKKFIEERGYRSLVEINMQFSKSDHDLIIGHLDFLISKGTIRRIKYRTMDGKDRELYYVPV